MRNLDFEIAWHEQINRQLDELISQRDYLPVRLQVVCIVDVLSGLVPGFKRLWATRMLVKMRGISNKERAQEKQRSALNGGTHTTLLCCCCACAAMSQKTGVLAVRRIDICGAKAAPCTQSGYRPRITCIYINSLENIHAVARLVSAGG